MNCTTSHGYRQHRELLQRELGQWAAGGQTSLTPMHQRIVHTLDWLDLQALLGGYSGKRSGAPKRSRLALAPGLCGQGRARAGANQSVA